MFVAVSNALVYVPAARCMHRHNQLVSRKRIEVLQPKILAVNPGSTSTKIALFRVDEEVWREELRHDGETISQYPTVWDQFDFRMEEVGRRLDERNEIPQAVVGIGGLLRPVSGGTYRVNEKMLKDARASKQGSHASNLGCAMVEALARRYGCPGFIVDPVSVDEFEPLARFAGHPLFERKSLSHALNIHATVRIACEDLKIRLEDSRFVVAHLGGGISVAPVRSGKIIDVNDAASGGPFSGDRSGSLPLQQLLNMCYGGVHSESEVRSMMMGRGGLMGYLGTNSLAEAERRIAAGDDHARTIVEAMAYQIAKEIGAMATVLSGKIDAIILTGGMATSETLLDLIRPGIGFLGPVLTYPGENELRALAQGAQRVLSGIEQECVY